MGIPLRIVDCPGDNYDYWSAEPGDMWLCPSAEGSHDVEGRPPCWVIRLPGNAAWFHTNMESSDGGYWDISGEPPNISISPSINVGPEIWHGWITNGELV